MPLDAATFGLVPADGGAEGSASFPMVAPHPTGETSPSGVAPQTNLSPEDYAKFMAGQSPPAGKASAKPSEKPLDASAFGLEPVEAPTTPEALSKPETPATEPSETASAPQKEGLLSQIAGAMAATADAIPRGVMGNATDYLNAATQTPLRMMVQQPQPQGPMSFGFQGPLTAFNQGLANAQDIHKQLSTRYPIASTGGELMSGAAMGAMMAPMLGYTAPAAAGLLPKIGAAADYLGRNASVGGLMSALSGGSPTTGAAVGGGLAATLPGVAKVAALPFSMVRQLAPLWSSGARTNSVQQTLARDLGGAPIATSPVGPLDLAQATGNPTIAAKARYAQGIAPTEAAGLQADQATAARGQIGQIGAPASAPDASTQGVNAIRDLRKMASQREGELWNVPALTDYQFPTAGLKQTAQTALNSIQQTEPGLLLGMTGDIRGALDGIGKMPDRANLQNINSFIGALKAVSRRPPPDNPRAGVLASRILDAINPALDSTVTSSGAPSRVQQAYQTARDFTRQRATVMGTQDMRAVLSRNPTGAFVADPSEGLRRFFNFSNGSGEGPQNIQQLVEFADGIKNAVLGRGQQAQALGMARDQLRDAARSYVAAALTDASRLNQGQNFNPKLMQDFLRKNSAWMQTSGLFQRPQIEAAEKLIDYAALLRRTEGLNPQGGSPTQARQEAAKTFIDQIMSPWTRRIMEATFPVIGHGAHGGGMGVVMGAMAIPAVEKAFTGAEGAMRDLMASAVLDSRVAKDLMMKPGNEGFFSPQTRELVSRLRLAIGSDVAPHMLAKPSPATVQVGQ